MPNINLRDGRNRDAMVTAVSTTQYAKVDYVDATGAPAKTRKVLKAVGEMGYERLLASKDGDADKLAADLVADDSDIDMERIGLFLSDTSRVFVNAKDEIVYQIEQTEIVRGPMGEEKERRPRRRVETNVDGDIPISWTGKKVAKADAMRRFVFSSKLQIMHVNGLTYDFLYGMAKELSDTNSLMLLGAGKSGKEPLIFRRGQTAYRGFLEGRIDGAKYMLILHLSKMELKRPVVVMPEVAAVAAVAAVATQPAVAAAPEVAPVAPVKTPEPTPAPVAVAPVAETAPPPTPHTPSVREVLAAVTPTATADMGAREAIGEGVATAKAVRQKKTKAALSAEGTETTAPEAASAKPARKPRAPKARPSDKPVE